MSIMHKNIITNWLFFTAFMVLAMAVIGAVTRLTESGLSMVEWRPLIGALPPLNDAECCLLYTSPSPRDSCASRMPSSA